MSCSKQINKSVDTSEDILKNDGIHHYTFLVPIDFHYMDKNTVKVNSLPRLCFSFVDNVTNPSYFWPPPPPPPSVSLVNTVNHCNLQFMLISNKTQLRPWSLIVKFFSTLQYNIDIKNRYCNLYAEQNTICFNCKQILKRISSLNGAETNSKVIKYS